MIAEAWLQPWRQFTLYVCSNFKRAWGERGVGWGVGGGGGDRAERVFTMCSSV